MFNIRLAFLYLTLMVITGCQSDVPIAEADFAFVGVHLVDAESGEMATNQTVLIMDGKITGVGPFASTIIAYRAQTIFAQDQYLIARTRVLNDRFGLPETLPSPDDTPQSAIKVGATADLMLFETHPLTHPVGLQQLVGIYRNGQWIRGEDLAYE